LLVYFHDFSRLKARTKGTWQKFMAKYSSGLMPNLA
jgi:hypothetical protein